MELTWWVVAIAGCLGLAACVAAAALKPMNAERRRLRLLANVERLTRLPEYRRAARLRTLSTIAAIILLTVTFGAAVVAAARPTGLPSTARQSDAAQPEDIMLCMGGPPTDPAVRATLRYFAERVTGFTTQRIGLTTANRRIVPMTRDYQYAAEQFNGFAAASEQAGDDARWTPAVSYVNHAGGVEDVMALCLTGFPEFDEEAAQRRSLIYVGPGSLRQPGETRPALFTADAVRDLVEAGSVQVNVLMTGPGGGALEALARESDGRAFPANSATAADLAEIRDHPPPPTATVAAVVKAAETPDVLLLLALVALTGLTLWPLVVRR
ncbi:hypothetical protein H7J93_19420 [Mycobacterium barrassiae]|uniref:hypothetical protein n=1 Tax=Mycobacterium barrassiae TaxID=319709 RepID=UPI002265CC7A|nr:hypothetical protein [Mycobacterium barrassiae]MCV7301798.1 hypothetical protein [Mycobacterium barrassiae]